MTKPLSIITVVKDDACGFLRTAAHITSQRDINFKNNVDWIVVNGSTQSSDVANFMAEYDRYISWSQSGPDDGIYHAMNKGLDHATGRSVVFMNAGDTFGEPDTLKKVFTTMDEHPAADFFYGNCVFGGHFRRARPISSNANHFAARHQSMIYRRDIIGHQRYDEHYKIAADYKFTLDYMRKSKEQIYINETLSNCEANGVGDRKYLKAARENFHIREEAGEVSFLENCHQTGLYLIGGLLRRNMPWIYPAIRCIYDALTPAASDKKHKTGTPTSGIA